MKNEKLKTTIIYDRIIFFLYGCLFFFTPLVVYHKTSELFEFNKMLFIYFISLCILFVWVVKMIVYKKIIIKKTFLDIPILLFFSAQLIATIFSIDQHTSFFGYYGRFNGGLLSLLVYIILFYAFVSTITHLAHLFTVLKISLISSVVVIFIGLPGRLGHDFLCWVFTGSLNNACWTDQFQPAVRMFSTLGQPNWLGAYLAIHFFIGFYFLIHTYGKQRLPMILYACYMFLNFTALLFTRSRSALFAVCIGLVLLFIYLLIAKRSFVKPLCYFILLFLIPLFVFKTGISKIDRYISFSPSSSTEVRNNSLHITDSFDIRKIVWQGAWQLALHYPWFGTGVETFAYSYYFTRPLSHNLTSEWDFVYNKAHNEYLNYAATTGFIGLGAYLTFIIICIERTVSKLKINPDLIGVIGVKSQLRSNRGQKLKVTSKNFNDNRLLYLTLLLGWVTILITNFFGFSTFTINLFFYLIPAFVMILSQSAHTPQDKKISALIFWQKSALFITVLVFVGGVMFLIGYMISDISYARASNYARNNAYDEAVHALDRVLTLHYEHVYEDKLSSHLVTLAYLTSYKKDTAETKQLIVLADQYNARSLHASSKNLNYWRTKAKNYFLFYQMTSAKKYFDESIASFNDASNIAPTDPKTHYMKSFVYSYAYDEEPDKKLQETYKIASLESIDHAIQLKNNYRDAYLLKGQLLKKYGRKDEARELFEQLLRSYPDDEEVKKERE